MRPTIATAVTTGLLALALTAPAGAQQTAPFQAQINRLQLRSQSCDAGVCAIVFDGSGAANLMGAISFHAALVQDFTVTPCNPVSGVLTFVGRTGSITLADHGTVCGNTASPSLFPNTISSRWTIASSAGEFSGITGSGTSQGVIGGDGPVVHFTGSLAR